MYIQTYTPDDDSIVHWEAVGGKTGNVPLTNLHRIPKGGAEGELIRAGNPLIGTEFTPLIDLVLQEKHKCKYVHKYNLVLLSEDTTRALIYTCMYVHTYVQSEQRVGNVHVCMYVHTYLSKGRGEGSQVCNQSSWYQHISSEVVVELTQLPGCLAPPGRVGQLTH